MGDHEKYRDRLMDSFPMAAVSIGWTCLINSILNCGENISEKDTRPFAYCTKQQSQEHMVRKYKV